jgi:putative tryptophan/tyrosine transport system substrate-binding protein
MLVNPHSISTGIEIKDLEGATGPAGLQLLVLEARTDGDLDTAFGEAAKQGAGALLVSADSFFTSRRNQIVELAARHALPASYPWPQYAQDGGLMSYGTPLTWAYREIGVYTSRILKGAKPNDLPVQLPTQFEMIINLKTAKSLGISVPPFVIPLADKVIE